jgi:hypothetical protein
MRLACVHELHGVLGIDGKPRQPIRIVKQQAWSFVGGETPGKAKGECIAIEDPGGLRDFAGRASLDCNLPRMPGPEILNQRFSRRPRHVPDLFVGGSTDLGLHVFQAAGPTVASAGIFPKLMCFV